MQRAKGQLEAEILHALWDADAPLTAKQLQARIDAGPTLAVTTIITVLERMRGKGLVDRAADSGRSFEYFAARTRLEHADDTIHTALNLAGDRTAALMRLAGSLTESDRSVLRDALDKL